MVDEPPPHPKAASKRRPRSEFGALSPSRLIEQPTFLLHARLKPRRGRRLRPEPGGADLRGLHGQTIKQLR